MRWLRRGLIVIVALLLLALVVIFATGNGPVLRLVYDLQTGMPELPFDPNDAVAAPDYANEANWAALPWRAGPAAFAPAGAAQLPPQGSAPVDVFFIHPTGFLKGSAWTFNMDANTSTEENTRWMMANQASAFSGCCNVYAPRYRQASIFTYFKADDATRDAVLAFAYTDVAQAFDYFLEHYNAGRPFVLASHSQGTHHGIRLLRERIDGTPLAGRMVAAYLIGGGLERSRFDGLTDVSLCAEPGQLHCAVHWDTWSETAMGDHAPTDVVCVNPLTWQLDGGLADSRGHRGSVVMSGEFHVALSGDDSARGVVFDPLGAAMPGQVSAQCAGGKLYITDQAGTPFEASAAPGGNYHGLDYPIFHQDIRENVRLRIARYLGVDPRAGTSGSANATRWSPPPG